MDMETQVRQALARGYCHPANASKEVDADLIEAMAQEVVQTFTPVATSPAYPTEAKSSAGYGSGDGNWR
jgi:hypothetical protein